MKYLLIILLAGSALADICTITGYVYNEDGTEADRGTLVRITDSYYNTSYETSTGGRDWPLQNFYVQTLTCIFNDTIVIEAEGVAEEIVYDHYPYEVNLTIPEIEKPVIDENPQYIHDMMKPEKIRIPWFQFISLTVFFVLVSLYLAKSPYTTPREK